MRKEEFFEVLGGLDDDIVKGAKAPVKKQFHWKVWGTMAACFCVAIMGAFSAFHMNIGISDGVDVPGSGDTGGIEGGIGMYSVAVFPPTEREQDVMAANVTSLTESELMQHPLAAHLPKELPNGFHYGRGSHYETTMKDGTKYNMLRIEYITGTIPEQRFTEDGGAIAPDPGAIGSQFLLTVWDFEPKPKEEIYAPEDVTLSLLKDGSFICIQYDNIYVGVSAETAEAGAVLETLKSIEY
ncbi:MAG: hypothetical protein NC121_18625 [Blautia sp.]|nr:hypothetical protein [Blautia sp.]